MCLQKSTDVVKYYMKASVTKEIVHNMDKTPSIGVIVAVTQYLCVLRRYRSTLRTGTRSRSSSTVDSLS